jgi:uncharacterized protein YaaN involved in tellurite resistance
MTLLGRSKVLKERTEKLLSKTAEILRENKIIRVFP